MTVPELNSRQGEILKAVIQDHILTAEPVGSRAISRRYGFHLSPASIRNTMADLEEYGCLAQPHTSAGRIPTDLGYRLYVDRLMQLEDLRPEEAHQIEAGVATPWDEAEELLRGVSRILSALTGYTCVVLAPRLEQSVFGHIDFVSLGRDRLLVVFVAASGMVQQRVLTLDEPLTADELDGITRYLNEVLEGKTVAQVRTYVLARIAEEQTLYDRLRTRALALAQKALEEVDEVEVVVNGAARIASQPEFADVEKMRALVAALEEKTRLVKILDACLRDADVTVVIGQEAAVGFDGVSVIASPYRGGSAILGVVGIMGPTRMPYARMVPLVAHAGRLMSRVFSEA
jgi:heat-inducible transcriptional repressor